MAADLTFATDVASGVIPVVLVGGEGATGLADMLQQFIEQTLSESPRKVRQARRLVGRAVFRSAEDEEVCVCITFAGTHIELRDDIAVPAGVPSITADFLTIAHLTSGRESPFLLLARRKLRVRFSALQLPFLLAMLRFMRIESGARRATRAHGALWILAAAGAAGMVYWYVRTMP